MFEKLKESWKSLKRGRPGSRFVEQYERQQKEQKSRVGRVLRIIAGVILFPLGLFLLPAPGPGFIVVGLGAVLIAREFRFAAVLLDGIEVRARNVVKWAQRVWRRLVAARGEANR